jgi:hypothetical protein
MRNASSWRERLGRDGVDAREDGADKKHLLALGSSEIQNTILASQVADFSSF